MTLEELFANQVTDQYGNVHFVVGGKLIASYFKSVKVSCRVTIEVVYDEVWEQVRIERNGPVVVVYSHPVQVGDDLLGWLANTFPLETFWVIGAINGLAFCSDLLPIDWVHVALPTAMSSDLEMDGTIDERHNLARALILHLTGQEWDKDLVERERM